jgi:hypothetical protein
MAVDPNGILKNISQFYDQIFQHPDYTFVLFDPNNKPAFVNGQLIYNKQKIERAIILFPIGFTVGIDIRYQDDQIKGIICFSKYQMQKSKVVHNINNTNIKDFLQAVGRARKIQYGLPIVFGTLNP